MVGGVNVYVLVVGLGGEESWKCDCWCELVR